MAHEMRDLLCRDIARLLVEKYCDPRTAISLCKTSTLFWKCGADWYEIQRGALRKSIRAHSHLAAHSLLTLAGLERHTYIRTLPTLKHCTHCDGITQINNIPVHVESDCPLRMSECMACQEQGPDRFMMYRHECPPRPISRKRARQDARKKYVDDYGVYMGLSGMAALILFAILVNKVF